MLQSNYHYLQLAMDNPELLLDPAYIFIEEDEDLDHYVTEVTQLKELLIAYKVLSQKNQDTTDLLEDILNIVTNKYGSKSEFACFMNACRVSIGQLKQSENKISVLKDIIDWYTV